MHTALMHVSAARTEAKCVRIIAIIRITIVYTIGAGWAASITNTIIIIDTITIIVILISHQHHTRAHSAHRKITRKSQVKYVVHPIRYNFASIALDVDAHAMCGCAYRQYEICMAYGIMYLYRFKYVERYWWQCC